MLHETPSCSIAAIEAAAQRRLDITTAMPRASPAEVEQHVTLPIEMLVHQISGVEYVYSTSSPGQSLVIVRFLVGAPQKDALIKVCRQRNARSCLLLSLSVASLRQSLWLSLHGRHHGAGAFAEADARQAMAVGPGAQDYAIAIFQRQALLAGLETQGVCAMAHFEKAPFGSLGWARHRTCGQEVPRTKIAAIACVMGY